MAFLVLAWHVAKAQGFEGAQLGSGARWLPLEAFPKVAGTSSVWLEGRSRRGFFRRKKVALADGVLPQGLFFAGRSHVG